MNFVAALGVAVEFSQAKSQADSIEAEVTSTQAVLKRFPRSALGLVSDEVGSSPEYKKAKSDFDRAFLKLQKFNKIYVKRFAKELREERNLRRAAALAHGKRMTE